MNSESDKEILVRNDENDNEGVTPVQGGLGVKGVPFLSQSSSTNQLAVPDPALASNSSSRLSLSMSMLRRSWDNTNRMVEVHRARLELEGASFSSPKNFDTSP